MSLADAARELDVSPATLRRWAADGLVPLPDGERWAEEGG
jgi:DNA-binding transcriptional MerR regulator